MTRVSWRGRITDMFVLAGSTLPSKAQATFPKWPRTSIFVGWRALCPRERGYLCPRAHSQSKSRVVCCEYVTSCKGITSCVDARGGCPWALSLCPTKWSKSEDFGYVGQTPSAELRPTCAFLLYIDLYLCCTPSTYTQYLSIYTYYSNQ